MDRDTTVTTSIGRIDADGTIGRLRAENLALRREIAELSVYRQLALRDALTGLHNRRAFEELVRREWARYRRCGVVFSMIVVDLDDFKAVNDTFGHVVGDGVLRWFARAARLACRDLDVVCRIGGDEFVILLPATNQAGARVMRQRLADAVASDVNAPRLPGRRALGFSSGCCAADEVDGPAEMLERADDLMYRHKRSRHLPGLASCLADSSPSTPWTILPAGGPSPSAQPLPFRDPNDDGSGPPAVA